VGEKRGRLEKTVSMVLLAYSIGLLVGEANRDLFNGNGGMVSGDKNILRNETAWEGVKHSWANSVCLKVNEQASLALVNFLRVMSM
jgi:hypothetical protein